MASVITAVLHGLSVNDPFYFSAVTPDDTGIDTNILYYVKTVPTVDTFTFSETLGGTAVVLDLAVASADLIHVESWTAVNDGNMSPPTAPSAPGSCVLTSTAGLAPDGTVVTRLNITITQPTSATLRHTIVTVSGGSNVVKVVIPVGQTTGSIASVIPGVSFTGSAVSYDTFGLASSATVSSAHVAAGDVTAPSVPTGLAASGAILGIVASWTAVSDTDLSHYELAISTDGGGSFPTVLKTKSTLISVGELSSGVKTVKVRAVDLTGNASAYSSTVAATSRITDLVTNSTAKVTIDSSGLTIIDGVLTMQDEFGKSVLGASGFSGSWYDFVRLGLYNSRFLSASAATGIAVGRTAAMPYWTLAKTVGSPTFDVVANTGLRVNWAAVNNAMTAVSDKVPCLPTQYYQVPFTIAYSGVTLVTVACDVFWYKADGSASTTASTSALYRAAAISVSGTGTSTGQFDPVAAPSDARFAAVKITLTDTLHAASQTTTLYSIGFQPATATNLTGQALWLGTGTMQDSGSHYYEPAKSFTPFAVPPGLNNATDLSASALALATVAAGAGGAFAAAVQLTGPMYLDSIRFWNTDTSLARSAEAAVYRVTDGTIATLERVAGSQSTWSATPASAGSRTMTLTGGQMYLPPGMYIVVIRNTSTARSLGLGGTANGTTPFPSLGYSNATASVAALGATLDLTAAGWGSSGSARGLGLWGSGW